MQVDNVSHILFTGPEPSSENLDDTSGVSHQIIKIILQFSSTKDNFLI